MPACVDASDPVNVQAMPPAAPLAGCVVTLQAVTLAGSGALQLADTNAVKAGVASWMMIVASGSALLLL